MIPLPTKCRPLAGNKGTHSPRELGALLIEFVLVAPVILILLGYVMRLTHMLQAQQIAANLSRELATEIFIKCADFSIQDKNSGTADGDEKLLVDTVNSKRAIQACLTRTLDNFNNNWRAGLKPSGAVDQIPDVSLWVYRDNFASLTPCTQSCNCATSPGYTTITITQGSSSSSLPAPDVSVVCQRNRVVRAYLHFKLKPLDAFLSLASRIVSSGSFNIDQDVIEETVI